MADAIQLIKEWVDWIDNKVIIGADRDGGINVVFYNGDGIAAGAHIDDDEDFERRLTTLANGAFDSFKADK